MPHHHGNAHFGAPTPLPTQIRSLYAQTSWRWLQEHSAGSWTKLSVEAAAVLTSQTSPLAPILALALAPGRGTTPNNSQLSKKLPKQQPATGPDAASGGSTTDTPKSDT